MTPTEALHHIRTLVESSAELKDDTQRKVLLRGVVVVAQKGLGVGRMAWPNASLTSCIPASDLSAWLASRRRGTAGSAACRTLESTGSA